VILLQVNLATLAKGYNFYLAPDSYLVTFDDNYAM